ncbi:MAG: sulfur carrier protein ThiS [Syntrophobacteraceae bacterium]
MEITVNGEKKHLAEPMTVSDLLGSLGINPKSVAVECNLRIVSRAEIESEIVKDGDVLEIIRLVGGG